LASDLESSFATAPSLAAVDRVLLVADIGFPTLAEECRRVGLECRLIPDNAEIPGSYWGESEAGLVGAQLFVRADTPVHSALHEASHFVCMDGARRRLLERDAGGDYDEENAVCYLQILWGDRIRGVGARRMQQDMDRWGYTFRLGSATAWFEKDADDARQWLLRHGIIDASQAMTYRVRT
jgi:hypothetical protein